MTNYLLSLLVFSPLIGIGIVAMIPKTEFKTLKQLGFVGTIIPLVISLYLYAQYHAGVALSTFSIKLNWLQFGNFSMYDSKLYTVDYELSVDGFSLLFVLLTTILSTIAAIASMYIKKEWKGYFILFFLLEVGMLGVFTADNLILFFLFFEVTFVALFFLIGRWGYENKEKAAYSFLIYNGIGSAVLLLAIMFLFARAGTTNIEALTHIMNVGGISLMSPISASLKLTICCLLLLAFAIKLPVFPFHGWMVLVHKEAAPSVVMLHAGVLLKIGAYGMIRFGLGIFPAQMEGLAYLLVLLGVISFLYGAFLALKQMDIKLVLAYSSVSHMGLVLVGLGALNEAGLQGAIFQVISHGLIAALLFFLVGVLYERSSTTMIGELGGLAAYMPVYSGVFLAAGLASLGLPGMSGFISEFMVFLGVFKSVPILAAVACIGLIITVVYMLRMVLKVTFGKKEYSEQWSDVRNLEYVPTIILVGFIIAIGVYPALLADLLQEPLKMLLLRIGG